MVTPNSMRNHRAHQRKPRTYVGSCAHAIIVFLCDAVVFIVSHTCSHSKKKIYDPESIDLLMSWLERCLQAPRCVLEGPVQQITWTSARGKAFNSTTPSQPRSCRGNSSKSFLRGLCSCIIALPARPDRLGLWSPEFRRLTLARVQTSSVALHFPRALETTSTSEAR